MLVPLTQIGHPQGLTHHIHHPNKSGREVHEANAAKEPLLRIIFQVMEDRSKNKAYYYRDGHACEVITGTMPVVTEGFPHSSLDLGGVGCREVRFETYEHIFPAGLTQVSDLSFIGGKQFAVEVEVGEIDLLLGWDDARA